jgi:hypothetical protein
MRRICWIILATLIWAGPVPAHQKKEAITTVLFNPRTGNIEVMHRFLLHDAEHALRQLLGPSADILDSAQSRKSFEYYVHERFFLSDQDGEELRLATIGHEIEGRFIWIYQEASIPESIESLAVIHGALRDLWPEQVNLVNVERDGTLKSARFEQGATEIVVEF